MKLPNAHLARIDLGKLRDYCLSPSHPRGRHKARLFAAALGLTATDAPRLREFLLRAAVLQDAIPGEADAFGSRYAVDAQWPGTSIVIRSLWIVRPSEDFPRLTSCYVL